MDAPKLSDNFCIVNGINAVYELAPVERALPKSHRPFVATLERAILSGKFPPGDKLLGENSLARRYGLSRAAVREGLEALKARGLISSRRGSGSYVATNAGMGALTDSVQVFATLQRDRNTYQQMMDLRMFLEGECIARLAREGKAVSKKWLREKLVLMDRNRDNLAFFSKADLAFHLTLVDESGLKLHATIMRGLLRGVGFKYARETYVDRSVVARVLEEHSAICDALESGGVRESKKALRAHLQSSLRRMETLIRGG